MQLMNQCGFDCLDNSVPPWGMELGRDAPLASSGQEEHGVGDCDHLIPWHKPTAAGLCAGTTCPVLWAFSTGDPSVRESPAHVFLSMGHQWQMNKCLGSWMASMRFQLDSVGFPSGTSSDCVSCFLSKGRKSPTSGFSWTGWVIHFALRCPFLRLQLGSLNRKLSQTDWTLGKPFYDPEYTLHTVFVSLPGAQTSWAPSPLPGRASDCLTSTVFPCMLGMLEIVGA